MSGKQNRLSVEKCNEARSMLERGDNVNTICEHLGIHKATLYRLKHNLKHHNSFYPPSRAAGRPRVMGVEQERRVLEYLDSRPTSSLEEVAAWASTELGSNISSSGIWRIVKRRRESAGPFAGAPRRLTAIDVSEDDAQSESSQQPVNAHSAAEATVHPHIPQQQPVQPQAVVGDEPTAVPQDVPAAAQMPMQFMQSMPMLYPPIPFAPIPFMMPMPMPYMTMPMFGPSFYPPNPYVQQPPPMQMPYPNPYTQNMMIPWPPSFYTQTSGPMAYTPVPFVPQTQPGEDGT